MLLHEALFCERVMGSVAAEHAAMVYIEIIDFCEMSGRSPSARGVCCTTYQFTGALHGGGLISCTPHKEGALGKLRFKVHASNDERGRLLTPFKGCGPSDWFSLPG